MFESRRHAVDLGFAEAMPSGFVAPFRHGLADFRSDRASLAVIETEISGDLKGESEGSGVVVLVDGRAEDAWFDVGRHRVEVVGGRQAPAGLAFVEKSMIPEMVVGI